VTRIVTKKADPKYGQMVGGVPRKSVYDVVELAGFPSDVGLVGRLDCATSGVVVLTDDSVLSKVLRDPPRHVHDDPICAEQYMKSKTKVYEMKLLGTRLCFHSLPTDNEVHIEKLNDLATELAAPFTFSRDGYIHEVSSPLSVEILRHYQDHAYSRGGLGHMGWCVDVRVAIVEGKHHQLRRMAKRSGLVMLKLHRVCLAGILSVESVPLPGDCRWIEPFEVEAICAGLGIIRQHHVTDEEIDGKV
jgi:hypothetical protein